jgi:hypothetical protein
VSDLLKSFFVGKIEAPTFHELPVDGCAMIARRSLVSWIAPRERRRVEFVEGSGGIDLALADGRSGPYTQGALRDPALCYATLSANRMTQQFS